MRIAYLNLCHTDPQLVARAAQRLTEDPDADMYIHVDLKSDITPFEDEVKKRNLQRVWFINPRQKIYWGGFHAVNATLELIDAALSSGRHYDRLVLLQNLDYPLKSWQQIHAFFEAHPKTEFIRACCIANSHDWHFEEKYKICHHFDDDFYLSAHSKPVKLMHNGLKWVKSIPNLGFNGVIHEYDRDYPLYYGSAQWAITAECGRYILSFAKSHDKFNKTMSHIKFPDEEYFQTIVHNSPFEQNCSFRNEPVQRWLVNWRNLHYYEYPKEIVVFKGEDFDKLIKRDELFVRKVRTGVSDELLNRLDQYNSTH